MGKIILRNVNFSIDKLLGRDPTRDFDIEGDSFEDLKNTVNQLGQDLAKEFECNVSDIKVKNATLKENRFVIFDA